MNETTGTRGAVDPPIAAILEQINAITGLSVREADPEELRAADRQLREASPAPPRIEVGSVRDAVVPGPAGDIPVRVYRPEAEGPVPTVVFFHGGGWVTGDLDSHDLVTRRICRDVGAVVVAVHYRRAPEHPFPAAYDDCLAVALHVADHIGDDGGCPDRLAVAGDSAGANLSAAVALAFRDRHRPLAAQLLAYPATDFDGDFPSHTENAAGYLLTREALTDFKYLYAGDDPAVRTLPQVSPLRAASHAGLAPAIIGTARFDPVRDEGVAYGEALRAAGVDVFSRTYDGLIHAFLGLFPLSPAADAAFGELCARLKQRLADQAG
ncbi:alpha/beta hydrolase [Kitasatospora sp. NPDC101183]|uniref:alpha/beta hydrolase n=1 Tax=Kitasatospora sp. NPDC101183 TaxID=3364100 RepID=UPI0037F4031C